MRPYFIAEVGSNHNGDLERAMQIIIWAANIAHFDAVKFQMLDPQKMFAPEVIESKKDLITFDEGWLPELRRVCINSRIEFGLSVYHPSQVDVAAEWADFLKVSSYDLGNTELLKAVGKANMRTILSTGMADLAQIAQALNTLAYEMIETKNLTLLHCVSLYPCSPRDANLQAMDSMRKNFKNIPVGWSDHTGLYAVIHRAVYKWGAEVIEMHVDLDDGCGSESGGHCWLMDEASNIIHQINDGLVADGDGRKCARQAELFEREWRSDPVDGLRPLRRAR